MIGPCMCGATDCPSCGPAQGYYRCTNCGNYGCDQCKDGPEDNEDEERELKSLLLRNIDRYIDFYDGLDEGIKGE